MNFILKIDNFVTFIGGHQFFFFFPKMTSLITAAGADGAVAAPSTLTLAECEKYDRQIRLWGIEAQQRLQNSRVLFAGQFRAVSAEISKNLVLAGFSASIMDPDVATAEDLGANFLLTEDGVGQNRALAAHARLQELNPMVKVTAIAQSTDTISSEFLKAEQYNVVVLSGPVPKSEIIRINHACRATGAAFFYVDMFGFLGIGFSDLGDNFAYRSGGADEGTETLSPVKFAHIEAALNTPWSELSSRRFGTPSIYYAWYCLLHYMEHKGTTSVTIAADLAAIKAYGNDLCQRQGNANRQLLSDSVLDTLVQCHACDVSAACAIMGGLMGQEIVKSIARKSKPLQNVLLLDAFAQAGRGGVNCSIIPPSLK